MSLYLDASALMKLYVDEADSDMVGELVAADDVWLTGRHSIVEVRRNLARLLSGRALTAARAAFAKDLASITIIELDVDTCDAAASIAEVTGVRTLDALHLAAAQRITEPGVGFVTFDAHQARAARALGMEVMAG